jgi:hypothetical protein
MHVGWPSDVRRVGLIRDFEDNREAGEARRVESTSAQSPAPEADAMSSAPRVGGGDGASRTMFSSSAI